MKITREAKQTLGQARETMDNMTDASKAVIETTNWATVALVAVAGVSVLSLIIGFAALARSASHGH